jgi:hypothetical protein
MTSPPGSAKWGEYLLAFQRRLLREFPRPDRCEGDRAHLRIGVRLGWSDYELHLPEHDRRVRVAAGIQKIVVREQSAAQGVRVLVGVNIFEALQLFAAPAKQGGTAEILSKIKSEQYGNGTAVPTVDHLNSIAQIVTSDVIRQAQGGEVGEAMTSGKIRQQRPIVQWRGYDMTTGICGGTTPVNNKLQLILRQRGATQERKKRAPL